MANPRELIEVQMQAKLAEISPATYSVPRAIRLVTRRGKMIDQVPPEDKPAIVMLTEENESAYRGIGGVKDTTLTVALVIYAVIQESEEPATVLNLYTAAITDVLEANQYWGGLAITTTVEGVAQHEIMESMLPDAKCTVAALVRYIWARDTAA